MKSRSSFTTYRHLENCAFGGNRCIGVGTVELKVKRRQGDVESKITYTLMLENVFHTPDTLNNRYNPYLMEFRCGEEDA
jgi:hypothetical protein